MTETITRWAKQGGIGMTETITRCPNCKSEYRTATKLSSNGMHRANKWWNTCPNADCGWVLEVRVRPFTRHDETLVKAENKRVFEAVTGSAH